MLSHPRSQLLAMVIAIGLFSRCAPAITPRPPAIDPTSAQSGESPVHPAPPLVAADPLLTVAAEPLPEPKQAAPAKPPGDMKDRPAPSPEAAFTCVMHPEVRSDKPGRCAKCGMKLVPAKKAEEEKGAAP
jgi:hypothetical protein